MLQQPFFSPEVTTIAGKFAIAADHPVTGHDDADSIFAIGSTHRPDCFYIANAFGKLEVADRFAIGNIGQMSPYILLKHGTWLLQRQIELHPVTFKIFSELLAAQAQQRVIRRRGRRYFCSLRVVSKGIVEKDSDDVFIRGLDMQHPYGRFKK